MINARNAFAFALAAAFAAAPALAQEATPRTNLIYGDTQLALEFQPNCSPGVDCPYFALTCGVGEVGLFVVNLDASHIERWAQTNDPAHLVIGDSVLDFTPGRMLQDDNGGWFVQLDPAGEPTDVLWAVYSAEGEIILAVPFYYFVVDTTAPDVQNMVDFAIGCLGAAAPR
jgi:hypothetical protein